MRAQRCNFDVANACFLHLPRIGGSIRFGQPTAHRRAVLLAQAGEPGPRLDLPTAELVTSLSLNILVMIVALLLGPGTHRYLRRLLTR